MVKRLLSSSASDVAKMSSSELKQAILASEGRTICSENVVMAPPVAGDITNAEVASAYGADLILLNAFDCLNPIILSDWTNLIQSDFLCPKNFFPLFKGVSRDFCYPIIIG